MMTPQVIRPSRWYYLLSLLVVAIGAALFFVITIKGVSSIPEKLTQMEAPGMREMTFNEKGKYTIFYEHQSVMDGRVYDTGGNLSGLWLNVVSKETNTPLALTQPSVSTSYTVGNRSGVSVLEFNIDRPGVYQVMATHHGNNEQQEVVLAIGHGVTSTITVTVIGALAAMFGSIIVALIIGVFTFIKRRKARRALMWGSYPHQPLLAR